MPKKGIILAGGNGTRLASLTIATNKHLLPVYDKPMIYYPLTTLMLAGIRDILVITNPRHIGSFAKLLQDGSQWGIRIEFAKQATAGGIAEACLIAEDWLGGYSFALILGDNIFYGAELGNILQGVIKPTIFIQSVKDPERYGVYTRYKIEEKPKRPRSNWAVTGLYFHDAKAIKVAKGLERSARGELEITDVNNWYLQHGMEVRQLGRGFAWFDAGTADSLLQVSNFIQTVQERQGLKIGDPDEVAEHMGFVCDTARQSVCKL